MPATTTIANTEGADSPEADAALLDARLKAADAATLMLVLVHLTRNRTWLEKTRPYVHGPMSYQQSIPDDLQTQIRAALADVLAQQLRNGGALSGLPEDSLLAEMMTVAAGEPVAGDYIAMMKEDLESAPLDPAAVAPPAASAATEPGSINVLIIGAGVSGLCAGIRLREAGIPFEIIEKNATVGGTWYENSYPGCGVDTPNHFYSLSFEPNHEWSHFFAKRNELWAYLEKVADRYAIREKITFGTEVVSAVYDEADATWRVITRGAKGETRTRNARVLVSAVGVLNRPKLPDIKGAETFAGSAFHTAQWDQTFDWRGKRVAMVGTGASGHQVGPAIASDVAQLTIFQRSPHWTVPNPNYHLCVSEGKKWALANIPHYMRWYRFQLFWGFADGLHSALSVDPDWPEPETSLNAVNARHRKFMERHIRTELEDRPDLLPKTIPPYPPYAKRILIDTHWYKMLKRPNVDLMTDGISEIVPEGVKTADGTIHPADAIVFATGFKASQMLWPMEIIGRKGQSLRETWGPDDAKAYLGMTVPNFPNLFILIGPNTGLAHGGNQIFVTECQVRYLMSALKTMKETKSKSVECRQEIHDRYIGAVDAMHAKMVWTHKGATNWYRNARGRVFAIMPWRLVDYWKMTSHFDAADYRLH